MKNIRKLSGNTRHCHWDIEAFPIVCASYFGLARIWNLVIPISEIYCVVVYKFYEFKRLFIVDSSNRSESKLLIVLMIGLSMWGKAHTKLGKEWNAYVIAARRQIKNGFRNSTLPATMSKDLVPITDWISPLILVDLVNMLSEEIPTPIVMNNDPLILHIPINPFKYD